MTGKDRAAVVASAIVWAITDAVRDSAPVDLATIERRIADLLRDEFAAFEQDLVSERSTGLDQGAQP